LNDDARLTSPLFFFEKMVSLFFFEKIVSLAANDEPMLPMRHGRRMHQRWASHRHLEGSRRVDESH
jgi:hypothetical protein